MRLDRVDANGRRTRRQCPQTGRLGSQGNQLRAGLASRTVLSVRVADSQITIIARRLKRTEEETMFGAQGTLTPARPWHLWLIGIIGGLWSSMGVLSFILTQMKVEAVMSRFPPQQREYFESFPLWAVAFWAVGVFSGVIGCLLLLLENRLAFPVLLASVIAAVVFNLGGLLLLGGME